MFEILFLFNDQICLFQALLECQIVILPLIFQHYRSNKIDLYKTTRKKFTRKINRIKRSIWKVSFNYWSCLSLSYFVESSWNIFTTIVHDGSMPLNNSLDACSNNRPTLLLLSRNNFAFLLQPRIVPTANKEQERGNRETLSTLECQRDFLSCLSCMLLFNARINLHFETRKVVDCFFFYHRWF